MNDEQRRRVHINNSMQESELAEADRLYHEADPGTWKIQGGRVVRFNGDALTPRSLPFLAASISLVPRLLRWVRTLEEALEQALGGQDRWKRMYGEEVDRHRASALRASENRQADGGLSAIAELLKLSTEPNLPRAAELIARWQGGEDIAAFLEIELRWLRKAAKEQAEARLEKERRNQALVEQAQQLLAAQRKKPR